MEKPSKGYLAYWNNVIFQRHPGGNWWVLFQHHGQRRKLSLKTPVKTNAAARARNVYLSVISNGWADTIAAIQAHGWHQDLVPVWLIKKPTRRAGSKFNDHQIQRKMPTTSKGQCKVPDCDGRAVTYDPGFCASHYYRWQRYGDVKADVPFGFRQPVKATKCKVESCDRQAAYRSGFCGTHNYRWLKYGDAQADVPVRVKGAVKVKCQVADCDRQSRARGFCVLHYERWHKYGDVKADIPIRQYKKRTCVTNQQSRTNNERR
jgi:hypothetical protein